MTWYCDLCNSLGIESAIINNRCSHCGKRFNIMWQKIQHKRGCRRMTKPWTCDKYPEECSGEDPKCKRKTCPNYFEWETPYR